MGSMIRHWVLLAAASFVFLGGCKDDGSFKEHEKTSGEEVGTREEHGDTAIDDADEADEWEERSKE